MGVFPSPQHDFYRYAALKLLPYASNSFTLCTRFRFYFSSSILICLCVYQGIDFRILITIVLLIHCSKVVRSSRLIQRFLNKCFHINSENQNHPQNYMLSYPIRDHVKVMFRSSYWGLFFILLVSLLEKIRISHSKIKFRWPPACLSLKFKFSNTRRFTMQWCTQIK